MSGASAALLRRQFALGRDLSEYAAKREFMHYLPHLPKEHLDTFLAAPDAYLNGRLKPPGLLSELGFVTPVDGAGNNIGQVVNPMKLAMLSPQEMVQEFNLRIKAQRRDRGGTAVLLDGVAHNNQHMLDLTRRLYNGNLSLDQIIDANTTRHTVVDLPGADDEGYLAINNGRVKKGDVVDVIRIPDAAGGNPTFRVINRTQEAYLLEDGMKGAQWSKTVKKGVGAKRGRPRKKKATVVAEANA